MSLRTKVCGVGLRQLAPLVTEAAICLDQTRLSHWIRGDGGSIRPKTNSGRLYRKVCHYWCLWTVHGAAVSTKPGRNDGKMAELLMKSAIARLCARASA